MDECKILATKQNEDAILNISTKKSPTLRFSTRVCLQISRFHLEVPPSLSCETSDELFLSRAA